jgi:hypothetical protein
MTVIDHPPPASGATSAGKWLFILVVAMILVFGAFIAIVF